jgi:hypothetical protein
LGVNPGFTHFGSFGGYLGFGSFSPVIPTRSNIARGIRKYHHQRYQYHTISIYLYRGGYIGGIWGIGLLLDSPLDRYIDMLDSMILWMRIWFWFRWYVFG